MPYNLTIKGKQVKVPRVTEITQVIPHPELDVWRMLEVVRLSKLYPDYPVQKIINSTYRPGEDAARGTRVHAAIAAHLSGEAVPVLGTARPWFDSWYRWSKDNLSILGHVEQTVYFGLLAGTIDYITLDAVYDWKTCKKLPSKPWPAHIAQIGAYSLAGHFVTKPKWELGSEYLGRDKGYIIYVSPRAVRAFPVDMGYARSLMSAAYQMHYYFHNQPTKKGNK